MFFKRFYDAGLAQASYLIGCDATGDAIVIDANRDLEPYLAAAAAEKLRIVAVTETHIHADYLSGARELAQRTGAQLVLSGEGGPGWEYTYAAQDRARIVRDGDVIQLGRVRLDVWHTPGHTPEHLSFIVTDEAASDRPIGIVSGDFVFVGDVGRPDLLERAAGIENTMTAAAHTLFASLARFRSLPDFVQVWPGHGAGSACGKALGAMPQSTVGYEKVANWGLLVDDREQFTTEVLADQPEPPFYFAVMKRLNRDGPAPLGGLPHPPVLDHAAFDRARVDAVIIDTRTADAFAAGHLPGTVNIPFGKSFSSWAGWLTPYDRDVILIVDAQQLADAAAREMAMIGLDRVIGWSDGGVVAAHAPLEPVARTTVADAAARIASGAVTVVDVRNRVEFTHGHIAGAVHIPVGQLGARFGEIPRDKPILVHCQGGLRSAIATSVLLQHGVHDVTDLLGGYNAWTQSGGPVVHED